MEFNVDGADKSTGQQRRVTITAFDERDAADQAARMGLVVSRIWAADGAAPTQSTAPAATDRVWLVHDRGRQFGPTSQQEIAAMAAGGQVSSEALVWRVGMAQWLSISTIVALPPISSQPPRPPLGNSAQSYSAMAAGQQSGAYAGFWMRVGAVVVDFLVILIPSLVVRGVFRHDHMDIPLSIVGRWLYEALLESSTTQATVGKMAFGIRVTDEYGNRISFGRATGRHFAKIISALTLGVGFMMAGFTQRKQALHDLIAGTLVVRGPANW